MNLDRELISQLVIILAVCVGGWMMFVEPKASELAELEAEIEASSAPGASGSGLSFEAVVKRMSEVRSALVDIADKNDMSERSSVLYGLIKDLANDHGVRIHRLQPGGASRGGTSEAYKASRIELSATGRYESIADLMAALSELPGFVRPTSLSLTPLRDATEPDVTIRFTCEVLRFEFNEVLATMGTQANAQP